MPLDLVGVAAELPSIASGLGPVRPTRRSQSPRFGFALCRIVICLQPQTPTLDRETIYNLHTRPRARVLIWTTPGQEAGMTSMASHRTRHYSFCHAICIRGNGSHWLCRSVSCRNRDNSAQMLQAGVHVGNRMGKPPKPRGPLRCGRPLQVWTLQVRLHGLASRCHRGPLAPSVVPPSFSTGRSRYG